VRDHLQHDVGGQRGQRDQRHGPVEGLGEHPAAGGQDGPVGRGQPGADRRGERDQREHPGVEQQEALDLGGDHMSLAGGARGQGQHRSGGDQQAERGPGEDERGPAAPG
jgi:hypothetical protein